jgi:hypothetical protein
MSNSVKIDWIEDVQAMKVADRLGIQHTVMEIAVSQIDRRKSAENRARDIPLDEERIEGITHSYRAGIPMPMIFVRIVGRSIVIAGGNHRFNGLPPGVETIAAHAMECTDSEFELLCRALNTIVGVGMSHKEKVRAAVDAVRRLSLSQKHVCEIYGLSKGVLSNAVNRASVEERIVHLVPAAKGKVLQTHCVRLGELSHNDNVLKAAATFVAKAKCSTEEFSDLATAAKAKTTEAEQVEVFTAAADRYAKGKVVSVPRHNKRKFLTALSHIESVLEKKSWSALEIESSEVLAIKARIAKARNYLDCLLKANG